MSDYDDLVAMKGDTSWFQQDRLGMFIHWGLYAEPARHEWVKNKEKIRDEDYQKYFEMFDPDLYDPKAWAKAAKNAGMKYFVITTKHHEGFCLWDSKFTDYKATNTPCGRDVLKEMVDAFRAEGLRVGFYYSLIDWHHPEFPVDKLHPQREDEEFRKAEAGRDVKKYAEYMRNQVRELLTDFGQIDVIWFDFSYPGENEEGLPGKGHEDWESEELYRMIRELQPNIMINNRLDLPGVGDFVTPEQYQPLRCPTGADGEPLVWEACQTFSGSWGYHRDESSWKTVDMLLRMLIDSVSKRGNLLLNVGPTARGEFDYRALDRLSGMGEWMQVHSRSIYGCTAAPEGIECPQDCRLTYNPETNRLYVHVFAWPFKELHLPGLAGKIKYAQFLNDASEIAYNEVLELPEKRGPQDVRPVRVGDVSLQVPIHKPPVEVPVIEIFMK